MVKGSNVDQVLALLAQSGEICFQTEVQICARYSGHFNNVGCMAKLKTSFKLNPVTEGNQGTFPFLYSIKMKRLSELGAEQQPDMI